jgi:hypothetical protein
MISLVNNMLRGISLLDNILINHHVFITVEKQQQQQQQQQQQSIERIRYKNTDII